MRLHPSAASIVLLAGCRAHAPAAPEPVASPLTPDAAFLDRAVAGRSIVLLGESLHGTNELPRARLPLLKRLHEHLGFDVLAVEGSALDAWLAQDDLYRGASVRTAAAEGWLVLWDTDAMRSVLEYVRDSKMYLASMDIQPAMGGTLAKKAVLRAFVERMNEYAGETEDAAALASALEPLRTCKSRPTDAVVRLRALIAKSDHAVRAKNPMHADALARVSVMLDERLHHCVEAAGSGPFVPNEYWKRYKEARDRYQAENVLGLREKVSRSHEVVVWAHHSHVGYRAGGAQAFVSIGNTLRAKVLGDVYSIGTFGGAGRFLEIMDGPQSGHRELAVSDHCTGLQDLAALSNSPSGFFVDLTRHDVAFAHGSRCYPLEGSYIADVLANDFDGVVFVPRLSPIAIDP